MILNLGGGAGMSAETEEKIDAIYNRAFSTWGAVWCTNGSDTNTEFVVPLEQVNTSIINQIDSKNIKMLTSGKAIFFVYCKYFNNACNPTFNIYKNGIKEFTLLPDLSVLSTKVELDVSINDEIKITIQNTKGSEYVGNRLYSVMVVEQI